ncbi:hypothetical protein T484DRAFT_1803048 [Baffinella frigidus]|nr:hypothetical protein T484DRAFT_1803048 [Cryptophyta sp. CCMP2293]
MLDTRLTPGRFSVSQLYAEDEWPKGLEPAEFIDEERQALALHFLSAAEFIDEERQASLAAHFEERARPELHWAEVSKASSSTHTTLLVAAGMLILGWNEIMWLLNHPFYLLLLLASLGAGAVYYLLNFVADWQIA